MDDQNNVIGYNPTERRKNYVLYRTVALGWQPKGWVICNQRLTAPSEGLQVPGTAWVEAPEGKYSSGNILPAPETESVTDAK
ncbi:hypothetical protein [Bombella apis]|uniref:hypothetical protein n=1 Tax=Bombella apis TaxID=1785988 RepID=UPI0012B720D0|nr:hypothetical protein [Bombella apis]MPW00106.1 hypothetical protein [Bombella apis]